MFRPTDAIFQAKTMTEKAAPFRDRPL